MSTLTVATIETEDAFTNLTLTTGNTSGPEIIISSSNNDVNLTGDFIVSGNVTAAYFSGDGSNLTNAGISTGKAIAMAIVFG
jgi:hypothetical protein